MGRGRVTVIQHDHTQLFNQRNKWQMYGYAAASNHTDLDTLCIIWRIIAEIRVARGSLTFEA